MTDVASDENLDTVQEQANILGRQFEDLIRELKAVTAERNTLRDTVHRQDEEIGRLQNLCQTFKIERDDALRDKDIAHMALMDNHARSKEAMAQLRSPVQEGRSEETARLAGPSKIVLPAEHPFPRVVLQGPAA